MRSSPRSERTDSGFTLLEALVAIALMGLILSALAMVTANWLPSWNRGLVLVQRNEQVATALDRLVADLSEAQYISPGPKKNIPLFRGADLAMIFVRSALGPNSRPGLEIVRIAETSDKLGRALVRTRAPFTPLPNEDPFVDAVPFKEPVVLMRAPLRVFFAYANANGRWTNSWNDESVLPSAVRFDVRDGEGKLVLSTATRIHVEIRAP